MVLVALEPVVAAAFAEVVEPFAVAEFAAVAVASVVVVAVTFEVDLLWVPEAVAEVGLVAVE